MAKGQRDKWAWPLAPPHFHTPPDWEVFSLIIFPVDLHNHSKLSFSNWTFLNTFSWQTWFYFMPCILISRLAASSMIRVYPAATRIDSSNFNPIAAWALGAQMSALNCQTSGSWRDFLSFYRQKHIEAKRDETNHHWGQTRRDGPPLRPDKPPQKHNRRLRISDWSCDLIFLTLSPISCFSALLQMSACTSTRRFLPPPASVATWGDRATWREEWRWLRPQLIGDRLSGTSRYAKISPCTRLFLIRHSITFRKNNNLWIS